MNSVTPLPKSARRAKPLPNVKSYEDRIAFHRFAAASWAMLATSARAMLEKTTAQSYGDARDKLEAFILRALDRAQGHYRAADQVRRRGHA